MSDMLQKGSFTADADVAVPTLAVATNFPADAALACVGFWLQMLGTPAKSVVAPLGGALFAPGGVFHDNRNGLDVLLASVDRWADSTVDAAEARRLVSVACDGFVELVAAQSLTVPLLVIFCQVGPAAPDWLEPNALRDIEIACARTLRGIRGVRVVTSTELVAIGAVEDLHLADVGSCSPQLSAAIGTTIARTFQASRMRPYKVIALDADNTLWRGVCGEEGAKGVELSAPYLALQSFMVAQHDAGMLLVVCSKNDARDVQSVFDLRAASMPLKKEHITEWAVNWKPKSENLRELSERIGVGLDTFVFIDDNPVECAEVERALPQVLVLTLPEEPARIERFLANLWALDHLTLTEEDKKRTALYAQNSARERLRHGATSVRDFVRGLDVQISFRPLTEEHADRVAQLTQRTTQLNVNGRRRTSAEVVALVDDARRPALTVDVSDRFGNYGLVGVLVVELVASTLRLDTFVLSCRVLGRGVEEAMMRKLGDLAVSAGSSRVEVTLVQTQRNAPAQQLLRRIATATGATVSPSGAYTFDAHRLSDADADEREEVAVVEVPAAARDEPANESRAALHQVLRRIASQLDDAKKVIAMMQA